MDFGLHIIDVVNSRLRHTIMHHQLFNELRLVFLGDKWMGTEFKDYEKGTRKFLKEKTGSRY
jgi:hypothetical protein